MVAHLNIHTAYDLLNASLRIEDVINKAKMKAILRLQLQIMFCMVFQNFTMPALLLIFIPFRNDFNINGWSI